MSQPLAERQFDLPNRRQAASQFADQFADWCQQQGVEPTVVIPMQIAFDEVLTNVIDYAHADGGEHVVSVLLRVYGDRLEAEVIDDGAAFDPLAEVATPDFDASIEERQIGGLGMHLVRTLVDDVRYRRHAAHNHLRLCKRRPAPQS